MQALQFSPGQLAAANPVNAAMGASNAGSLQLASLKASGEPAPLTLPPAAGVVLSFTAGTPATFTLTGNTGAPFDASTTPPPGMLAPGFENKVMHSSFRVGGTTVMASDGCHEGIKFEGFSLSLTVRTEPEADLLSEASLHNRTVSHALETAGVAAIAASLARDSSSVRDSTICSRWWRWRSSRCSRR